MKRFLTLFIILFLFVFLGGLHVSAHGSTFQTATRISNNISVYGGTGDVSINAYIGKGESDYFYFTALDTWENAPRAYNIYSQGNIDTLGFIYKKNTYWKWDWFKSGYITEYNLINAPYADDDKGVGQNFKTELDIKHNGDAGDYYVKVLGYNLNVYGSYKLTVEGNRDFIQSTEGGIWSPNSKYKLDSMYGSYTNEVRYFTAGQAALYHYLIWGQPNNEMLEQYQNQGLFSINVDSLLSFLIYKTAGTVASANPYSAAIFLIFRMADALIDFNHNIPENDFLIASGAKWEYYPEANMSGYRFYNGVKVTCTSPNFVSIYETNKDYLEQNYSYYFEKYNSSNLYGEIYKRGLFNV
jgi:hypothetical protein